MGGISEAHAEWAVVDRMRQMMDEPHGDYLATQTYAMFTAVLCWVLQHLRIPKNRQESVKDRAASELWDQMANEAASGAPWLMPVLPDQRTASVGKMTVYVPGAANVADHSAQRLLINLRDAVAHGDARVVRPFNCNDRLVGFTFACRETKTDWNGELTLLREDMRRIGSVLATRYRDAILEAGLAEHGPTFRETAISLREAANDASACSEGRAAS